MHLTGLLGMPRRVFTYGADMGWTWLNLVSTIGAFVLAAGFVIFAGDCLRPKRREPDAPFNPWNAGTLEWTIPPPGEPWGMRSIPEIHSRYPVWDDKNLPATIAEGRGLLPHAAEGKRETIVSSVLDAQPVQVLRVGSPTWIPATAAAGLGAVFIFSTFKLWLPVAIGGAVFVWATLCWLWMGTAVIPEAEAKDPGNGKPLPLYVSGPRSTGWWAMFITMTGDLMAFLALIFGYFFFWTIHADFPPPGLGMAGDIGRAGPRHLVLTLACRLFNGRGAVSAARLALAASLVAAGAAAVALIAGPLVTGLDPTTHAYPAIVWVLVLWIVAHLAVGMLMQGYYLARSIAGPRLDIHSPDYLAAALRAFREGTRASGTMIAAARDLSDAEIDRLAAEFGRGIAIAVDGETAGREIAEHGLPGRDIPACDSCHGATARADYPRLAGQWKPHLRTQLMLFREHGTARGGPHADIMAKVARSLDDDDIEAIVEWYGQ